MAEALDMKVEGLKELADKLRGMGPDLSRNALRAAVRAGASTVRAEAINMAPQDTGRLRRAIYLKHIREKSGAHQQTFYVSVRAGKRYRKRELDAYYWRFVEFGTAKMAARPFMRPAFEVRKGDALEAIKARLAARIKTYERKGSKR